MTATLRQQQRAVEAVVDVVRSDRLPEFETLIPALSSAAETLRGLAGVADAAHNPLSMRHDKEPRL
jgi:hypothetical protein